MTQESQETMKQFADIYLKNRELKPEHFGVQVEPE